VSARFAVMYVATIVASLLIASGPAMAAPIDDINQVLIESSWANNEAITTMANSCSQASTVAQLDQALAAAHQQLDQIFSTGVNRLLAIGNQNPEYADEARLAIVDLTTNHNAAHAEAEYTYQLFYDALQSTTTTTVAPTTTTTTTVAPTTTTTEPPVTTTTVAPTTTTTPTSTTEVPTDTTTTTAPADTTSTTSAAVIPPIDPGPPPADGATVSDDAMAVMTAPTIWSMAASMDGSAPAAQDAASLMSTGAMSTTVMDTVSHVLPPALAQFTVAPFIVFEILIATLYDSTQQMALPVLLIIAVMSVFVWLENRRSTDSLPG